MENDIEIREDSIAVLQVCNTVLFSRIIQSIYCEENEIQNRMENVVLLENNKEISISKNVLVISDIWNFDRNQKKIQTALYQYIEKELQQDYEKKIEFENLMSQVENLISDIWEELPFIFQYKDALLSDYLKMLGLKLSGASAEKIIDRVLTIIDIVEYFNVAKVIIFINLKTFVSEYELNEIYKYAMYKKVKMLLIETGKEKKPIANEKIFFVDDDYEEFILYNRDN